MHLFLRVIRSVSAPVVMLLYFAPPRDPDRLLVFTHFPKTSGTSITKALQAALNRLMAGTARGFDQLLLRRD
jgi:hypothetical protein